MLNCLETCARARADLGLASPEASKPHVIYRISDASKTTNAPLPPGAATLRWVGTSHPPLPQKKYKKPVIFSFFFLYFNMLIAQGGMREPKPPHAGFFRLLLGFGDIRVSGIELC